jgi:hypothetical protein
VEGHQEHARCDADPFGACGDRCGHRHNRGEVAVFDEMVLGEPNVVESVVITPRDLIQRFAVEPIVGLPPLRWIPKVIPKTKTLFSDDPDSWFASLDFLVFYWRNVG